MTQQALRIVNFGKSRTGISSVGYTILNTDGTTQSARSVSGVYELTSSSGLYAANITFPNAFRGSILWDTGEASNRIIFAAEDFTYLRENPDVETVMSGTIITSGNVTSGSTTT